MIIEKIPEDLQNLYDVCYQPQKTRRNAAVFKTVRELIERIALLTSEREDWRSKYIESDRCADMLSHALNSKNESVIELERKCEQLEDNLIRAQKGPSRN